MTRKKRNRQQNTEIQKISCLIKPIGFLWSLYFTQNASLFTYKNKLFQKDNEYYNSVCGFFITRETAS